MANESSVDKRAKIIADQAAREQADREAGKVASHPEPRSNWAASPTSPGRKSPRRPRTSGWGR